MKNKIGEIAGKIWKKLKEKEEVSIAQLPKLLNENPATVYQGLGWLAREGKIEYSKKKNITFVSLTEIEKNI